MKKPLKITLNLENCLPVDLSPEVTFNKSPLDLRKEVVVVKEEIP